MKTKIIKEFRKKYSIGWLFYFSSAILITTFLSSCKDFIDIDPPINEIITETVFSNDNSANSAMVGIYSDIMTNSGTFAAGDFNSITFLTGLSSDELVYIGSQNEQLQFFKNALQINNSQVEIGLWGEMYKTIFNVNSIIEGVTQSDKLTEEVSSQLEGESKFLRAFCHFYLVNLFGEVPLITTIDFRVTNSVSRNPIDEVYNQIIVDLKDAQDLLSEDYSFSNGERVRPNKYAATALLSRVYLYIGDWIKAEIEASKIIDNSSVYSLLADLNEVFLANSTEAIWQLLPVYPDKNTWEAFLFRREVSYLSNNLLNSFESEDERAIKWIDSFISQQGETLTIPFKYKVAEDGQPLTEYSMVLRLAEQYLIRAEARANQGDILGAQSDLNIIRNRAGLPNTNANNQSSLLLAIEQEIRVELFTEWGHRWLSLKRMNRADAILSIISAKDWESTDILYPIPLEEIKDNPNLSQNDGY